MNVLTGDAVNLVKSYYEDEGVVNGYTSDRLYPAERIVFESYLTPGSRILDLGCGCGRTSLELAKKGFQVTAIDFAPKMIAAAKKQAEILDIDVEFYTADATKMTYKSASFDNIIFSYNGIEQIPGRKNREKVLQDVYKILKPGGYFIFTTRSGLSFAGKRLLGWGKITFDFMLKRVIGGDKAWEFGDYSRGNFYVHYINPFKIRRFAEKLGLKCHYFNSEKHIEKSKPPRFLNHFSNDRMLFYVFRKPAIMEGQGL